MSCQSEGQEPSGLRGVHFWAWVNLTIQPYVGGGLAYLGYAARAPVNADLGAGLGNGRGGQSGAYLARPPDIAFRRLQRSCNVV
jgi:hypothetical protein